MKFFVLVVAIFLSSGAVTSERLHSRATEEHSRKHKLYLLSILSYRDPVPSLNPSFVDGPDLFPATQLAVDHINNRSDVLRDYHIELIEADGGCNVTSKSWISLVSQLFHNDKQIVGIMGPRCSDSAKVVRAMAGRSEIALISVHQGSSSVLADRATYPYSLTIGIAGSSADEVKALIALIKKAKWSRVATLYNRKMLVDYSSFQLFERETKSTGIQVAFSQHSSDTFIPHQALKNSYARVILAFVRPDLAAKLLCVAHHNDLTYPHYQWFLSNNFTDGAVNFYYTPEDKVYFCSAQDMRMARKALILIWGVNVSNFNTSSETVTISGFERGKIRQAYVDRWQMHNGNITPPGSIFSAYKVYDAVWSMALALNGSLEIIYCRS